MKIELEKFQDNSHFNILHWEFGSLLVRRGDIPEEDRDAVTLLAAKCLQAVELGHTCVDLRKWHVLPSGMTTGPERDPHRDDEEDQPEEDIQLPSPLSPEEWISIMEKYPETIGETAAAGSSPGLPILFDREHRLVFLNKYYIAEMEIADFLKKRLKLRKLPVTMAELGKQIHEFNTLFRNKKEDIRDDPQQSAVAMALTHKFSILTGGPGTGKTTVLATILAMELTLDPKLRIGLAAPTGKASMQMKDSLNEELSRHLVREKLAEGVEDALRDLAPSTIHRMLGIGRNNSKPRFNETNPLPYDLIVIDESSMVSLLLMQQLCRAVADDCRMLLVGDQNQLAAVEAGCLLGDFCSRSKLLNVAGSSPDQVYITRLIENHRAEANPELKDFIFGINTAAGNGDPVSRQMKTGIDRLYSGSIPEFHAREITLHGRKKQQQETLESLLKDEVGKMLTTDQLPKSFGTFFGEGKTKNLQFSLENWKKLHHTDDPNEDTFSLALAHFYVDSFKIICGMHDGPFGEINLNQLMGKILGKKIGDDGFPVIILKNDSVLGLNNGDIGICWNDKVYFPKWRRNGTAMVFDAGIAYNRLQLPPHDPAYAMTIHKSQGSGFDNVLMSLPEKENRVLCRELIYTGISRTKRNFALWSPKELFCQMIDRETDRWSGMPFRLEK